MQEETAAQPWPQVNPLTLGDVSASLNEGWRDFMRAPATGMFFGAFYAAGGLLIWAALSYFHQTWLIFPIAIGFPLVGPFVAAGLYETSRRLSSGEPVTWAGVLGSVWRQRERELGWMAFVVLFVFWIWMYQIRLLTAIFLGFQSMSSVEAFLRVLTSTADGMLYLAVGTIVGAVLAMILYSTTVISIPLLMEREYDFVTAIITSIRAVLANPVPMIAFGIIVTLLSILAMLPLFLGLIVVLPVLGHATWHLYKRTIP
jgi:uncharacterized membrane protein